MDIVEKMAADIAVKLNGGEWSDGKWYSEGHRKAWIEAVKPHADEIERLREEKDRYKEVLLQIVRDSKEESDISDFILYLAEKALQQKDSE